MNRFSLATPPQLLLEEIDRLSVVIEAQKWVTALADALLAVPHKGTIPCSRAASDRIL